MRAHSQTIDQRPQMGVPVAVGGLDWLHRLYQWFKGLTYSPQEIPPMETLVDNAPPLTFAELSTRFSERGMTRAAYQTFNLPLSFEDITNPALGDEIVAYRKLINYCNA